MKKPRKIKYVKQEHEGSCAIACFAMLLDRTEKDVAGDFTDKVLKAGLSVKLVKDYLGEQGFSLIIVNISHYCNLNTMKPRLSKPFAPLHFVSVRPYADSTTHHAVVMDARGRVYDPDNPERQSLEEYYSVVEVIGLFED